MPLRQVGIASLMKWTC